jgi:hypothetical protein
MAAADAAAAVAAAGRAARSSGQRLAADEVVKS